MYCFCSQIHSLLELESVLVATAPLTYSLCIQHTTLRLCFSLQFFWCPTSLNASLLHSSLNIVARCETLVKMGTEQRKETKKYWRWKDDAPEAGPFATLVPPPAHPCTQPPPPPPAPSQCTRAITSSPWKRYYRALAPPLVESWGRHVLIRLLHSLLCTVLLLLLEKRTRGNVEAAVVQPQTAPSLDVAFATLGSLGSTSWVQRLAQTNYWYQRLLEPF